LLVVLTLKPSKRKLLLRILLNLKFRRKKSDVNSINGNVLLVAILLFLSNNSQFVNPKYLPLLLRVHLCLPLLSLRLRLLLLSEVASGPVVRRLRSY